MREGLRQALVAIEPEDEDFAVGVEAAAGGRLFILDWIGRHDGGMLRHIAAFGKAPADEIAFVVHIGIDVVGEVAVALIAFLVFATITVHFATITVHARFVRDPVAGTDQVVHIIKNIAIIGGLINFVAS